MEKFQLGEAFLGFIPNFTEDRKVVEQRTAKSLSRLTNHADWLESNQEKLDAVYSRREHIVRLLFTTDYDHLTELSTAQGLKNHDVTGAQENTKLFQISRDRTQKARADYFVKGLGVTKTEYDFGQYLITNYWKPELTQAENLTLLLEEAATENEAIKTTISQKEARIQEENQKRFAQERAKRAEAALQYEEAVQGLAQNSKRDVPEVRRESITLDNGEHLTFHSITFASEFEEASKSPTKILHLDITDGVEFLKWDSNEELFVRAALVDEKDKEVILTSFSVKTPEDFGLWWEDNFEEIERKLLASETVRTLSEELEFRNLPKVEQERIMNQRNGRMDLFEESGVGEEMVGIKMNEQRAEGIKTMKYDWTPERAGKFLTSLQTIFEARGEKFVVDNEKLIKDKKGNVTLVEIDPDTNKPVLNRNVQELGEPTSEFFTQIYDKQIVNFETNSELRNDVTGKTLKLDNYEGEEMENNLREKLVNVGYIPTSEWNQARFILEDGTLLSNQNFKIDDDVLLGQMGIDASKPEYRGGDVTNGDYNVAVWDEATLEQGIILVVYDGRNIRQVLTHPDYLPTKAQIDVLAQYKAQNFSILEMQGGMNMGNEHFINPYITPEGLIVPYENLQVPGKIEPQFQSEDPLKNYFLVASHEKLSSEEDLSGRVITSELIEEIFSRDIAAYRKNGWYKYYFEEVFEGVTVDRFRMDIGNGPDDNKSLYEYLEDKAVGKDAALRIENDLKKVTQYEEQMLEAMGQDYMEQQAVVEFEKSQAQIERLQKQLAFEGDMEKATKIHKEIEQLEKGLSNLEDFLDIENKQNEVQKNVQSIKEKMKNLPEEINKLEAERQELAKNFKWDELAKLDYKLKFLRLEQEVIDTENPQLIQDQIAKMKEKIEHREKDKYYADSWEQSAQIRKEITKLEEDLEQLENLSQDYPMKNSEKELEKTNNQKVKIPEEQEKAINGKSPQKEREIKEKTPQFDSKDLATQAIEQIKTYSENPEELRKYLDFMSNFPELSPRNLALLESQWSGANMVATYDQWSGKTKDVSKNMPKVLDVKKADIDVVTRTLTDKKTGETKTLVLDNLSVRQGEHSKITLIRGQEDRYFEKERGGKVQAHWEKFWSKEEKQKVASGEIQAKSSMKFIPYKVFEISQTNIKPESLPKLLPNRHVNFEANPKMVKSMEEGLNLYAKSLGVEIKKTQPNANAITLGNAKGAATIDGKTITMNHLNTPTENVTTLIHELAHATLHKGGATSMFGEQYAKQEFEAEMTSFVVANRYGIDTSEQAIPYIASWTDNMKKYKGKEGEKELGQSLGRVQKAANAMVKKIDAQLTPELKQSQKIEHQAPRQVTPQVPLIDTPPILIGR
jgi:hypothetical protein